jgi:AAA family ATP:ADP antiporter
MSSAAWEYSLIKILLLIVGFGVAAIFTFRWMNFNVLSDPTLVPQEAERTKKKDKKRLSFRESISFISRSKYLLSIAAIVIGYNLVINLVEVIWKDRLRLLYPSTADYNIYLNNLTSARGVISTVVSILMAGLIHKLGWTKTALITPIIMLLTSLAFFSCLFGDSLIAPLAISFLGMTPLALAVFFGSAQNCFSKAAKYSVFDATKEMAFIPLPSDAKMKGKAAIDGIGSRMAKSGGAVIHSSLLLVFGTLPACAPTVALIIVGISALWIMAVFTLGKEFALQTQAQPKEAEAVT